MLKLGLIGEKISHSVSPKIHQTLLRHTGLEGAYEILDVPVERLADLLKELSNSGYAGVNVTVPHKQAAVPFLNELSPSADALQAVNTIVFERKDNNIRLIGHNTDVNGFWTSVP